MKQGILTVINNKQLTPTTWLMELKGDTSAVSAPGQFINIRLDGRFLRRPISICRVDGDVITIIYKVLGKGTEEMTSFAAGRELDVLSGLGNGFDTADAGERPLIIGGGVGIPPLYDTLRNIPGNATVILGFNSSEEMYYVREFEETGARVIVATADGSEGVRGFVTDAFDGLIAQGEKFTRFYTCGPLPMLKAVYDKVFVQNGISGQMSFEERMGCGFGACMGCSMRVKNGFRRVCKDGPVFRTEELLWQNQE